MNTGILATFINTSDSVPFNRHYNTARGFKTALKHLKGTRFLYALDYENLRLITREEGLKIIRG